MALTKRMMAVGLPSQTARAVNGQTNVYASVSTTVSQAAATAMTADVCVVPNSQAAGAMILPSDATESDTVTLVNLTGAAITVYPPVGGYVQGGAQNAGYSVASGTVGVQFQLCADGKWYLT